MPVNQDTIQAAGEIAEVFRGLGVPYMIGGSVASTLWGEPRLTLDVDFVAKLEQVHAEPLVMVLGESWYADLSSIRGAIERNASFNLIRLSRMVKVDVFVPPDEGLHASKWERVRYETLTPDSAARVAVTSPEDIVLQKLDGFRRGGGVSENQWRDVTALLRIRGELLDDEYLDHWALRMDLSESLARARRDATK